MVSSKPGTRWSVISVSLFALLLTVTSLIQAQAPVLKGPPGPASALVVSIGETIRLQMRSKKPIKSVFVSKPDVVAVRPVVNDPTTILITGLQPGVATVELTDTDNRKEKARAAIAARP
jgi:hypothetical protein